MHTVEEIQKKLFCIPPIRSVTFGTKTGQMPLFAMIEELDSDESLFKYREDLSLFQQRLLAGGLHAFLFIVYEYQFDKTCSADELVAELESKALHCQTRLLFLPTVQMHYLINNATVNIPGRQGLIVASATSDEAAFYLDAYAGENLFQIIYTQNPLPKATGLA